MKKLTVLLVALVLVGGVVHTTSADETLVNKLPTLFKGLTPDQTDDAVTPVKGQLTADAREVRTNNLETLFDSQIATLKDRGTPKEIMEILENQKSRVLEKASSKVSSGVGNIRFLPVIPLTVRGPSDLMAMVRNGNQVGREYVDPTRIFDMPLNIPKEPYYIYDVEDGSATRGKSLQDAREILRQQSRSPLTVVEVIALATHTDVLSKHNVWALGSRSDLSYVPYLWLYGGPELHRGCWLDYFSNPSFPKWSSPSCGSR